MKIVIAGSSGLLGQEIVRNFKDRPGFELFPLEHRELDVTNREKTERVMQQLKPDVLINCAVIISIDRCQAEPELAYAVNRDGAVNLMVALAKAISGSTFIQISSSEVFGGWAEGEYKKEGWREDDERYPITVYQKSKREAEDLVSTIGKTRTNEFRRWYIIRASWLYGQGRRTFVEQFALGLQSRQELVAVRDQWRSPTWTKDFTESLAKVITEERSSGIYHIANEVKPGEATTMDVIEEIRAHFAIPNKEVKLKPVSRREFFRVPRAPSNILLNTKLPRLRYWRDALREYLALSHPKT